jgi:endoglucanase
MANFSLAHSNVIGLSLRNELRAVGDQDAPETNHADWYKYVTLGAESIHKVNPDALITIGGVDYFNDFRFMKDKPLDRSAFDNKVVWEYHTYSWGSDVFGDAYVSNCTAFASYIDKMGGYLLEEGHPYTGPVWMSEFGWGQISSNDTREEIYKTCLIEYMSEKDMDWSVWALQGSYYYREGNVDGDESYGLLNHNWTDWRNPEWVETINKMWITTLEA